jgi:hypothetical protein
MLFKEIIIILFITKMTCKLCSRCRKKLDDLNFKTCSRCREKKTKIKCGWKTHKNECCPWCALPNKKYCKRHSKYEVYNLNEINNLKRCSSCKNLFLKDSDYLTCNNCRDRKNNYEKIPTLKCKGITAFGKPCNYEPLENDEYCKNHQTYKKILLLKNKNLNICRNWIRGCFNVIDNQNKTCKTCLNKLRLYDNNLILIKKNNASNYNNLHNENKMCYKCNKIYPNLKTTMCLKCYDKIKIYEEIRDKKDPYLSKYNEIKISAHKRNIDLLLDKKTILKLISGSCVYCGKIPGKFIPNGIDRINSKLPYTIDNCLSCCGDCNIIKGILSIESFIENIKLILKNKNILNVSIDYNKTYFMTAETNKFSNFKYSLIRRNLITDFDEEYYEYLVSSSCYYCNNQFIYGACGIDRLDSSESYTKKNSVPCCMICNRMKNKFRYDDFLELLLKIYKYYVLKNKNETKTLEEKIIDNLTKVSNVSVKLNHEKFLYDEIYYKNLIWDGNINDLKKIKIKIEFLNNNDIEKRDIWNYYRKTISSFKINNSSRLVGKQIYCLIKDSVKQKYLGIISLSSDVFSIQARENYIGWNSEMKNKYLDRILNLTTCVPVQPFGYNFNGGKLLAEIIFSEEFFNEYKRKYKNDLIGITTFGLYGKSIMYDRLRKLKLIGYTKGNSYCHITDETYNLCKEFLKEKNFDYKKYKRFMIIRKTIDMIGLNKNLLTGEKKSCYIGFFENENIKFLKGELKTPIIPKLEKSQDIFKWWINRWAINRYKNLIKTNRIEDKFYSDSYYRVKKYENKFIEEFGIEKLKQIKKENVKKWRQKNKKPQKENIISFGNLKYKVPENIKILNNNNGTYLVFSKVIDKKKFYKSRKLKKTDILNQIKDFIIDINFDFNNIIENPSLAIISEDL